VFDAPLAVAFSAGLVTAINPCGFAMLPAYLSFFLGTEDESTDAHSGVGRALRVGLAVTIGFMLVFGLMGFAITVLSLQVYEHLPWITVVIGIGLVALGVAMLLGFEPNLRVPRLDKGGRDRTLSSMVLFGISYAIASLSCTLPVFLAVVGFERDGLLAGTLQYLVYALGMGLVLTVLTVAMALARHSLVRGLRSAGQYVGRVSGGLLILAGAYVAYYGWYELSVLDGNLDAGGPADRVNALQADVTSWIRDVGTMRVGLVLGGLAALAFVFAAWRRLGPVDDAGSPLGAGGSAGGSPDTPDPGSPDGDARATDPAASTP
jgi:cytochrome c biogenesis protein CcdA